jgi:hypothetical protein
VTTRTHLRLVPDADEQELHRVLPPAPESWVERAERLPMLLRILDAVAKDAGLEPPAPRNHR